MNFASVVWVMMNERMKSLRSREIALDTGRGRLIVCPVSRDS